MAFQILQLSQGFLDTFALTVEWLSSFDDRKGIAVKCDILASEAKELSVNVTRTIVKGKNSMRNIIYYYDQLRIMLIGSWYNKYSPSAVVIARDRVLSMVESELKELEQSVSGTIKKADLTLRLAKEAQYHLFGQKASSITETSRILAVQSWWEKKFGQNSITEAQLERVKEDQILAEKGLAEMDNMKMDLINLYISLKGFEQSLVSARDGHRKAASLDLSVEDLLGGLNTTISRSRDTINMWQTSSSVPGIL